MDADTRFVDLPLVYVAGPYTRPDPVANTHAAIRLADELIEAGKVTPVVPHLTLVWHLVSPRADVEFWYSLDLALVARCDALLRMPGASMGADREVAFAEKRGIPVFRHVQALHEWADAA